MTDLEVVDFKEVKSSSCLGYVIVRYASMILIVMLVDKKEAGYGIEFPNSRHKDSPLHCCWIADRDDFEQFQLIVITQLIESFHDAREIINTKSKKMVQ